MGFNNSFLNACFEDSSLPTIHMNHEILITFLTECSDWHLINANPFCPFLNLSLVLFAPKWILFSRMFEKSIVVYWLTFLDETLLLSYVSISFSKLIVTLKEGCWDLRLIRMFERPFPRTRNLQQPVTFKVFKLHLKRNFLSVLRTAASTVFHVYSG